VTAGKDHLVADLRRSLEAQARGNRHGCPEAGHPPVLNVRAQPGLGAGTGAVPGARRSQIELAERFNGVGHAVAESTNQMHATDDGVNGSPPCQLSPVSESVHRTCIAAAEEPDPVHFQWFSHLHPRRCERKLGGKRG
jgi:hypothetical protein